MKGGGGALKAKHYYIFVGGGRAVFCCCFVFQSSGQLAFVKMYNFLQVMVLLKNAVCSNGICWNEKKKFLFLEEGSPEKMSYVSAMVVVDLIGGGSREKLSPDYIPVKPG